MKQKSLTPGTNFKVISLNEIKGSRTGNFIIHLSKSEWDKAIKNIPVVTYNKKKHGNLHGVSFTPVHPSNLDLGIFVFPELCKNGCKKIISPEYVFGRCDCPPVVSTPKPGRNSATTQHFQECNPTILNGFVQCLGPGCIGKCTPELIAEIMWDKTVLYGYFVCKCK